MIIRDLTEKSIFDTTKRDIERFKTLQQRSDVNSSDIRPEKFEIVRDRIQRKIRGGKIKIFRAIDIEPYSELQRSLKRRLGIYWTHDIGSARVYRAKHSGYGDEYILEATINEKYIDWDATLSLNTMKTRGTYEDEIRLFKNTPIKLDNIYQYVDGKLVKEDITRLPNKFVS